MAAAIAGDEAVTTPQGWTPYQDGTSGHQGDASFDSEPHRKAKIGIALAYVLRAGEEGITWRELSAITGWHHGQASGALSNLHRTGYITRLADRRDRCGIYVVLDKVGDRETRPYHRNPRRPPEGMEAILEELAQLMHQINNR